MTSWGTRGHGPRHSLDFLSPLFSRPLLNTLLFHLEQILHFTYNNLFFSKFTSHLFFIFSYNPVISWHFSQPPCSLLLATSKKFHCEGYYVKNKQINKFNGVMYKRMFGPHSATFLLRGIDFIVHPLKRRLSFHVWLNVYANHI